MASAVIGALRVNLGIDTAAFSDGLKKAESSLKKFGAMVQKGLVAGAAAAGAALTGLGVAVRSTINAADDMAKSAQRFGIPIEELSRLKYAADLSGVSFNELGTGVRRLSQNMSDAAQGTGEGAKAFEQLGISVTNADGTLKSASEVMAEIADRFAAMPDGAEKTALAMDLMGRSGANMIPMLNGGAEALNNLMAEADTFGQVFTAEMGAQAEAFNDNLSRLTGTLGALTARIAADLLPHLVRFTDWLVENAPAIQRWANVVIEQFVIFGQNLAQLKTEIDNIIAAFVAFRDGVTTAVNEVDATLRAWSEQIIGIFAAIPGQMMEIGRNIISGLWQGILGQWEIFKADVSGLASGITNTFKSVLGIHSPSTVMAEIGRNIMQGLSQGMEEMKGSVSGTVGSIVGGIENAFSSLGSSIAEAIRGTKEWKDVALDAIRAVANAILSSMSFGGGFFGTLFKGLLGGLIGFANGGSFTVGGTGGIDSQLVAFRATPGEMVDIRKPGQDRGGGLHITFGLASDGALNIMPEVRSVSREESMAATESLAKRIPAMVDRRENVRNTRGTRA